MGATLGEMMLGIAPEDAKAPQADPLYAAVGVLVGVIALMMTCKHVVRVLLEKAEAEAEQKEGSGGGGGGGSTASETSNQKKE